MKGNFKMFILFQPASTLSSNGGGDDIPQVSAEVDRGADPDRSIQDQGSFLKQVIKSYAIIC